MSACYHFCDFFLEILIRGDRLMPMRNPTRRMMYMRIISDNEISQKMNLKVVVCVF